MTRSNYAKNQAAYRQRLKDKGLQEVRGGYAPKKNHPEIKEYIKKKYEDK